MIFDFLLSVIICIGSVLPICVAVMRGHPREAMIFALNAISLIAAFGNPGVPAMTQLDTYPILGSIGWGVALLWSFTNRVGARFEPSAEND